MVYVDNKFIDYLYNFDKRVMWNKSSRPYIGIVFQVKNHEYYAPLSSPKEKFLQMHNDIDLLLIKGGELGAICFNNMIPVNRHVVTPIKIAEVADKRYQILLSKQLRFFNDNQTKILHKADNLYRLFKTKRLEKRVFIRCCNFTKLEEFAVLYPEKNMHPQIASNKKPS
jgi:protein AbiQ